VLGLACVEGTAQDVWVVLGARRPLEGQLPLDPPCDHLAVELILRPVVEVQRTSFALQHVTDHFHQTWQVKFHLGVARDVFHDIEQGDGVLDAVPRFNVEVVFL
jgi:hypothetical protein